MKRSMKKFRDYMDKSLRRQLVFYLMAGVLLPLTMVTSVLFLKAGQEMKNQAVINVRQRSQAIAGQVDELVYNVRTVSDNFAYDEEIDKVIEKDYGTGTLEKWKDTYELNGYFKKTDPLDKNVKISGIYTKDREIFNFMDPNGDGPDVAGEMLKLGAMDKSTLSMVVWHPLQENFLTGMVTGDIRRDRVVAGVRRILHPFTGIWIYTQFYMIEERRINDLYRESADEMLGMVHIIDKNGGLVSSSDEKMVRKGNIPKELIALAEHAGSGAEVQYQEVNYIMEMRSLENVDWHLVTMVPVRAVTKTVDKLFREILVTMVLCVVLCVLIINWISGRFLKPVEVLDASMKDVYDGNLEAYVEPGAYHGEIKSMMTYYNAMLVRINRFITEQVESEKKKKELELEVLMGQINPHFLYNTLENIVWKSNEAGCPDIGRLAASLGRLYRLSIGNGEILVSVRQEVEHVMAYINIQKNRYKERIEFELRMDYEEIWECSMIKLTLQPVVENCFMYAMEGISHVLKIRLIVQVREDVIQFKVLDNGCGMSKTQLEEVRKQVEHGKVRTEEESRRRRKGTGIGLYSVKERIAIYTGYRDSLYIQSKKGMGTMVTITIPVRQAKLREVP